MYSEIIFLIFVLSSVFGDIPCAEKIEGYESVVCVCNATYCDEISKIVKQPPGTYISYTSSKDGLRFKKNEGKYKTNFNDTNDWFPNLMEFFNISSRREEIVLEINRLVKYQTMEGFGGAFTDSASIHFVNMTKNVQKNLIMSYYSENGIEYNMGRVPIGGIDFSTRPYAYNMYPENDITLSNFSLTEEDYDYKIPFIQMAQEATNYKLNLMAAAWSPPPWMKTSHDFGGISLLLREHYQTWADYHLKFLEEYYKHNISYWAISTGNEPVNGIISVRGFNSLGWLPNLQADWIAKNFGPTIKGNSKFKNIKIITLDDQRFTLPLWVTIMSTNQKALEYIDGLGIHWYMNQYFPIVLADITHGVFKDKFLIGTEASSGVYGPSANKVVLGSWSRAESFIEDIIDDLNHWFVGWLDWNLILDIKGGPNWFNNFADASVITFPQNDEFVKQPAFYIIGHFSKFIPRNSIRIEIKQAFGAKMDRVAFLRPDGGITVILYNKYSKPQQILIKEKNHARIHITIPPNSIHSLVYW